jgi:hypothetical protein
MDQPLAREKAQQTSKQKVTNKHKFNQSTNQSNNKPTSNNQPNTNIADPPVRWCRRPWPWQALLCLGLEAGPAREAKLAVQTHGSLLPLWTGILGPCRQRLARHQPVTHDKEYWIPR